VGWRWRQRQVRGGGCLGATVANIGDRRRSGVTADRRGYHLSRGRSEGGAGGAADTEGGDGAAAVHNWMRGGFPVGSRLTRRAFGLFYLKIRIIFYFNYNIVYYII
jgi:hypothetical protein